MCNTTLNIKFYKPEKLKAEKTTCFTKRWIFRYRQKQDRKKKPGKVS